MEALAPLLARFDILLLLFLRMLGLFMTAPVFSNRLVPIVLRVGLSFVAAIVVSPLFTGLPAATTLADLLILASRELMVGMLVGFIASLAFSGIQLAGQLMDIEMGLSIMNVLDPMTNSQVPVMGNFLHLTAMLIFFAVGGHHSLLLAVMDSYALVPLGEGAITPELSMTILQMAAGLFAVGLQIAAPVLAAVLLTTIALGILNRAVQQMNVFVIGMPIQLGVGLFMVMVIFPLYVAFLHVVFAGTFDQIRTTLRLLQG